MNAEKEKIEKELQEDLLEEAYDQIIQLKLQLTEAREEQVKFRDDIAKECFIALLSSGITTWDLAASDAYVAADVFLRVREGKEVISK